jgi:tRNA threonylcarbamoyladenosine biosynthesis protein TsaE
VITTKSPKETVHLGSRIAKHLKPDTVVALSGELGAGKTTLIQGIAKGLGIDNYVTSPTFTLINEFKGKKDLYHIDLYRINDIRELEDLSIEEYFNKGGIVVIEWAEKAKDILPKGTIDIGIKIKSDNERQFTFKGMELK